MFIFLSLFISIAQGAPTMTSDGDEITGQYFLAGDRSRGGRNETFLYDSDYLTFNASRPDSKFTEYAKYRDFDRAPFVWHFSINDGRIRPLANSSDLYANQTYDSCEEAPTDVYQRITLRYSEIAQVSCDEDHILSESVVYELINITLLMNGKNWTGAFIPTSQLDNVDVSELPESFKFTYVPYDEIYLMTSDESSPRSRPNRKLVSDFPHAKVSPPSEFDKEKFLSDYVMAYMPEFVIPYGEHYNPSKVSVAAENIFFDDGGKAHVKGEHEPWWFGDRWLNNQDWFLGFDMNCGFFEGRIIRM